MKIEMCQGQPLIGAWDLDNLWGFDVADVSDEIRVGEITRRFEAGTGADTGRFRLIFLFDDQRVRRARDKNQEVISPIRLKQGMQ